MYRAKGAKASMGTHGVYSLLGRNRPKISGLGVPIRAEVLMIHLQIQTRTLSLTWINPKDVRTFKVQFKTRDW